MKKRILLFTAVAAIGYLTLSSYGGGPAANGENRTGAKSSTANCAGGCHGAGTGATVAVSVMTGTTTVTQYVPGTAYTVKIHGTHASHTKFGFQFVGVSGTGAAQVNAGTASGFPTGVTNHTHSGSGLSITEHSSTRTGSSSSALDVQFTWTAPSTSVGNIYMYCTLNAVDGGGSTTPADVSANTVYTLTPSTLSIPAQVNNIGVVAYPNPVVGTLHLQTEQAGNYTVNVYDLNGRNIASEQMDINGVGNINASNWAVGLYHLVIQKDDKMQVIPVVKQ